MPNAWPVTSDSPAEARLQELALFFELHASRTKLPLFTTLNVEYQVIAGRARYARTHQALLFSLQRRQR